MSQVHRNRGDAEGAARALEAAKHAWRDADPDLPELTRIAAADAPAR
jgi:hypothetical protein